MSEIVTVELPGHLCVSPSCEWGRTTMMKAAGVFVSSVGEYRKNGRGNFERIGCDRLYETMVFRWSGGRGGSVLDGCDNPRCWCPLGGAPVPDGGYDEIGYLPANTREEAIANHEALVAKYASGVPHA